MKSFHFIRSPYENLFPEPFSPPKSSFTVSSFLLLLLLLLRSSSDSPIDFFSCPKSISPKFYFFNSPKSQINFSFILLLYQIGIPRSGGSLPSRPHLRSAVTSAASILQPQAMLRQPLYAGTVPLSQLSPRRPSLPHAALAATGLAPVPTPIRPRASCWPCYTSQCVPSSCCKPPCSCRVHAGCRCCR